MKKTDFASGLTKFFTQYLTNECGASAKTIDAYRYAFILFFEYISNIKGVTPELLTLKQFTHETIKGYLMWLETERKNSISSRNNRLAAIKSFVHYLTYEFPEYIEEYQNILRIPIKKSDQNQGISYLKTEGMKLLVAQIDIHKTNGFRDYIMIILLYTTGIRVSELINIRVGDLSLTEPYTMLVHGKGEKSRYVPLQSSVVNYIKDYISKMKYTPDSKFNEFLFKNHMGKQFTRQGINYMLRKYGEKAAAVDSTLIPKDLSPHKIRHTTAMELLSSGVDLIYIRDLLGHSSITTTEIYARTDAVLKRKAIEAASKEIVPPEEAVWDSDEELKTWLKNFNHSHKIM